MRLAFFSDVHGNLPALEAVLDSIKALSIDNVYCLGDLVDYGPFPNEVIDAIRREGIPTVMGNHDDAVAYARSDFGGADRGPEARRLEMLSFEWTKRHVTDERKAFLRTLPQTIDFKAAGKRVVLAHASPERINEYLLQNSPVSSFRRVANRTGADIIVYGHTHQMYTKAVDDTLFVNVGSVGRPRDGDRRACYALLDTGGDAVQVMFHRVAYDLIATLEAIRRTDLPDDLVELIETGR